MFDHIHGLNTFEENMLSQRSEIAGIRTLQSTIPFLATLL
jgi:hypothetical protein